MNPLSRLQLLVVELGGALLQQAQPFQTDGLHAIPLLLQCEEDHAHPFIHALVGARPGPWCSGSFWGSYLPKSILQAKVTLPSAYGMTCFPHPSAPVPCNALIIHKTGNVACKEIISLHLGCLKALLQYSVLWDF